MTGPESRAELANGEPFVIRGHHLKKFAALIRDIPYFESVEDYAKDEILPDRKNLEDLSMFDHNHPQYNLIQPYIDYLHDVLGQSKEEADKYEEHVRKIYEKFLVLADDYPAEIVEGIPDVICAGCAIGEHCRRLKGASEGNELHKGLNPLEYDRIPLNTFLKKLDNLNLPKPIIGREKAHFSDTEPQQVRRIETTVGTVRKILKEVVVFFDIGRVNL